MVAHHVVVGISQPGHVTLNVVISGLRIGWHFVTSGQCFLEMVVAFPVIPCWASLSYHDWFPNGEGGSGGYQHHEH